jgi:hypothetical protein
MAQTAALQVRMKQSFICAPASGATPAKKFFEALASTARSRKASAYE